MATQNKSTVTRSTADHKEPKAGQTEILAGCSADNVQGDKALHFQSKVSGTHLKQPGLYLKDVGHQHARNQRPHHLSLFSLKAPEVISQDSALDEMKFKSKIDAHSICQHGLESEGTTCLASCYLPSLIRPTASHCCEDGDSYHLPNEKDAQDLQVTGFANDNGCKWLKRHDSYKEEDALSLLVHSKQLAGSLKWVSPTRGGPREGSIHASSQMLQEHVVLLDLEANSSEEFDISVATRDVLPHAVNTKAESICIDDRLLETNHELFEGIDFVSHLDVSETKLPYSPGDVLERLSPIFDDPIPTTAADLTLEQVVPSESNVSIPNNCNDKYMHSNTALLDAYPQYHCVKNVCENDTQQGNFSVSSVPDSDCSVCASTAECTTILGIGNVPKENSESDKEISRRKLYYHLCDMNPESQIINSNSYDKVSIHQSPNNICSLDSKYETKSLGTAAGADKRKDLQHTKINKTSSDGHLLRVNPFIDTIVSESHLHDVCEVEDSIFAAQSSSSQTESTGFQTVSTGSSVLSIEELPEELIFKVLFYLSPPELCISVAPVSLKWRDYAYDPILWQIVDLSQYRNLCSLNLCQILRRVKLLKSLNLRGRTELNIMEIKTLGYHCSMLQEINLGFCETLCDDILQILVYCCKSLVKVNVEGCESIDNTAAFHFTFLPELRVLNMSHCTKITDEVIIHIAVFCKKLEAINIDGIPWISDNAIECLTVERKDTLKAVFLDGEQLTNNSIQNLTSCKRLHTLSISFCDEFRDKSLDFLKKLNSPKHLRLKRGVEFSAHALADLFVMDTLSSLTYLNLTECSELSDKGVENLARRCRRLQHLALCWCWDISDIGLECIMDNCGHLEVLDLLGLKKLRGKCLDRIPEALPHLTYLDLRECNMIKDSMLVTLVTVKKDLCILNYYGEEVKVCTCNDQTQCFCENVANPMIEH